MRPQHLPVLIAALVLSACTEMSKLPSGADTGPNPTPPEPNTTLLRVSCSGQSSQTEARL